MRTNANSEGTTGEYSIIWKYGDVDNTKHELFRANVGVDAAERGVSELWPTSLPWTILDPPLGEGRATLEPEGLVGDGLVVVLREVVPAPDHPVPRGVDPEPHARPR